MTGLRRAAVAAVCAASAISLPVGAALFGGKPAIPQRQMLKYYDETVVADKLNIASVSAGFAPVAPGEPGAELSEQARINPKLYAQSLAGLQAYVAAIAKVGPRKDIVPRVSLKLSERFDIYTTGENEIVMTTALVKAIMDEIGKNPDADQQLLFLLGHEYSHVLYDHPHRYAQKKDPFPIGKFLANAISVANALNKLSGDVGAPALIDARLIGKVHGTLGLTPIIETEIYRVTTAPYRKDAETLADYASTDLMDRIKLGDARNATQVLSVFETYDNSVVAQLKLGLKQLGESVKISLTAIQASAPKTLLNQGPNAVLQQAQRSVLRAIAGAVADVIKRRFDRDKVHLIL